MDTPRPTVSPFADPDVDLPPRDVAERLASGAATLVDIREPHERALSWIADSIELPIDRVASSAHTLDWSRPVIFHCRLGWRAGMVAHAFRAICRDAYNLDGGIVAWAEADLPITPAGAEIAAH
jgi:rhodanese-related sulfurtransferase